MHYQAIYSTSFMIQHSGVKGMHWGVRKDQIRTKVRDKVRGKVQERQYALQLYTTMRTSNEKTVKRLIQSDPRVDEFIRKAKTEEYKKIEKQLAKDTKVLNSIKEANSENFARAVKDFNDNLAKNGKSGKDLYAEDLEPFYELRNKYVGDGDKKYEEALNKVRKSEDKLKSLKPKQRDFLELGRSLTGPYQNKQVKYDNNLRLPAYMVATLYINDMFDR